MRDGFIKVAAATPAIRVADCGYNAGAIVSLMGRAAEQGVKVICFPELCVTGYTCGDLFLQDTLLRGAEEALQSILEQTAGLDVLACVGVPVRWGCKLYNCGAVFCRGRLLGLVPKTNLPNYTEFYEARWFTSGRELGEGAQTISYGGQTQVPFSPHLVFRCDSEPLLTVGVELCEDLWVADTPSTRLCAGGATLMLNPSASDEIVSKADWRRLLLKATSGRLACGYVYADAGWGESSTDLVYAGHDLVAENGSILAENRFETGLTVSEIDLERLCHERQRMSTFPAGAGDGGVFPVSFDLKVEETTLTRHFAPNPFVPADRGDRQERCAEILHLASQGLAKRLEHTHAATAVVGLSGGLDSTLAILITALAFDQLGRDHKDILAVTMPCFGTTDRTRDNACILAQELGADLRRVDIGQAVEVHFRDIGQSMEDHSVTFENGQARERTQVLMDLANKTGGLVIGTGDLSELALGWATYNGDHMSMYLSLIHISRQGGWNGGFAPYGYYLKDNQLLIEETEAEAIRIIFDKFANSDVGLGGVAKYLNLQGIKKIPRQNGTLETWSSHFIRLILDNPVYCGKIAYGRRTREKVKGTKMNISRFIQMIIFWKMDNTKE